jgi:hypothetical protein
MRLFFRCLLFLGCFAFSEAAAQTTAYPLNGAPLNQRALQIADRLAISTGVAPDFHTAQKPISRLEIVNFAAKIDSLDAAGALKKPLSKTERADILYLYDDNTDLFPLSYNSQEALPKTLTERTKKIDNSFFTLSNKVEYTKPTFRRREKPVLKYFYNTPADFWALDTRYFKLRANPILNFEAAADRYDTANTQIFNLRGVELRGSIDNRVFFYTSILETQARFANFVQNRILQDSAVLGNGTYKDYSSKVFKVVNGQDFLNGQAYIGFNVTQHIDVSFGHGRHFIGNGYRSMLLSNAANNYLYLQLNTRVWKFQYRNIFAELGTSTNYANRRDTLIGKKFAAIHHLSFNVTPKFNIGLFEAVVLSRSRQFELQYLNPVILYRTVEGAIGSPDNVLLGLDSRWDFARGFSLYGQALVDEFKFKELFLEGKGWWGNKYSLQLGLKSVNTLGIKHLDCQLEYNMSRPFTYTHKSLSQSYTHNRQALAHPLGANFQETLFRARYQPFKNWTFEGRIFSTNVGQDSTTRYMGNNLLTSNENRSSDYGHTFLQGVRSDILTVGFDASFQVFHNCAVDFFALARRQNSAEPVRNQRTFYVGGGVRLNFERQRNEF